MGSLPEQQAETVVFRSTLPDIAIPDHLPLHDYVFERLAERRDRACIIDGATGKTLTLGDVYCLSRRVAAGLYSLGVRHGSTVMLLLPNSVEFALAFLASSRLGAVTTTASPLHTPPEIAKQVAASGATVIVTEPAFVAKVRDLAGVTVVTTGDGAEGCASFADIQVADDSSLPEAPIDVVNDVVALPYSSGTTGLPKGVMLSHRGLVTSVAQLVDGENPNLHFREDDVLNNLCPSESCRMKDDASGEIPVAFVVVSDGADITEDEIKQYVAKQVVFYKRLQKVFFVSSIPKAPSGKILRKDLRAKLATGSY